MLFSKFLHILTIVFWAGFVIVSNGGLFAYIAILLSTIMLSYEHIIVSRDFTKIDKAFFTINGYLGIIFFVLIILDQIFK
jgi:4-hydroxybenzoate polyprenyltransferase